VAGRGSAEIRDLGAGRYLLDGGTRLDHLREELGIDFDAGGIDTIGGLVFNQLGHVPKAGERITIEGAEIKVRRVVRARIQELELRRKAASRWMNLPLNLSRHSPSSFVIFP
jgi:putative hemolysin